MKRLDSLTNEIRTWKGSVLGFGVDEALKKVIDQNNAITVCNLLEVSSRGRDGTSSKAKEQVSIKKLKKRFAKKQHTYLLADYETIASYKRSFVRDSIYLAKQTICLSLTNAVDEHHLVKMYERYASVNTVKTEDGTILWIDVEGVKTNFFLDKVYSVVDLFWDLFDLISDLMIG